MAFRDDLHAAHARIDALEGELAETRSDDAADAERIATLEAAVAKARTEIARLEREGPGPTGLWTATRRWLSRYRRWVIAALVIAVVGSSCTWLIRTWRRNSCPLLQASGKTDPDTNARLCACNDPSPWTCMIAADAYERGREVEPDLERALELYERACEHANRDPLHGGWSCARLAELDEPRALEWLERGCAVGDGDSCNNLGVRHAKTDIPKARELYAKACTAKHVLACSNAGFSWRDDIPRDPARSLAAFTRSCELGDGTSCGAVGHALDATDPATAAKHYQTACDKRVAVACYNLALLHREGRGVTRSDQLADELMRRACKAGERDACR